MVEAVNQPPPHGRRFGLAKSGGWIAEDATGFGKSEFAESLHLVAVGPNDPQLLDVRLSRAIPREQTIDAIKAKRDELE